MSFNAFGVDQDEIQGELFGLLTQFSINLLIGLFAISLFSFLRLKNKTIYEPRLELKEQKQQKHTRKRPPPLTNNLLGWTKPLYQLHENELIETIGLDAVMYIKFLKLSFQLFGIISVLGCGILVPVYLYASPRKERRTENDPLNGPSLLTMTLANLKSGSEYMWVTVAMTVVFTLLTLYFIHRAYLEFIELKKRNVESTETTLHSRTIMITGIPANRQSDVGLAEFYESLKVPFEYQKCVIGRDTSPLSEMIEKRVKVVLEIEKVVAVLVKGKADKPTHKLNVLLDKMQKSTLEIEQERDGMIRNYKPNSTGFITFRDANTAHIVLQQLKSITSTIQGSNVEMASDDIVWNNITLSQSTKKSKTLMGLTLILALSIGFTSLMLLLTSIVNLGNIRRLVPFINTFLKQNRNLAGFIDSILGPTLLTLMMILIPIILRRISYYQGYNTHSAVEKSVLSKFYFFWIMQVYVVFSVMTLLMGTVQQTVTSGNIAALSVDLLLDTLAQFLISNSTFYMNVIILTGLLPVPLALAQVPRLTINYLKNRLTTLTPRDYQHYEFPYATVYTTHLVFWTMSMTYATTAPMILLFALIYYSVCWFVYKYQMIYVYTNNTESGGSMWNSVVNRMLSGLVVFQCTVVLLVRLRAGSGVMLGILIGLACVTVGFKVWMVRVLQPRAKYVSGETRVSESGSIEEFRHPVFVDELMMPLVDDCAVEWLSGVESGVISVSASGSDEIGLLK